MGRIEVMNIDHLCKCVFTGKGTVCTYVDCMGDTFAVGPDGGIYPCYRFIGMPEWVMGNVYEHPTMADLAQSDAWNACNNLRSMWIENAENAPISNTVEEDAHTTP